MKAWQGGESDITRDLNHDAQDSEQPIDLEAGCSACDGQGKRKGVACRFCAASGSQAVANGLPLTEYNALIEARDYAADAAKGIR